MQEIALSRKSMQGLEAFLWCVVGIVVFSNYDSLLYSKYFLLTLTYWLANLIIIFLPAHIRHSLPIIIISASGFARYILTPFAMAKEGIIIENLWCYMMMQVELMVVYVTIFIFAYYRNTMCEYIARNYRPRWRPIHIGFSVAVLLVFGSAYLLQNNNVLFNYVFLSGHRLKYSFQTGYESIFITNFFLVIYCLLSDCIKRFVPNKFIAVICMICLSLFFINGRSIQYNNVSRWALIISALVAYIYISSMYPKYKKMLLLLFSLVFVFAITIGTMMKVSRSGGIAFQSTSELISTQLSFRYLNAYFSGPMNFDYVYIMSNDANINAIPRLFILFSDIFANFPLLNKFISSSSEQSTVMFNYKIYNSYTVRDQIIPLSGQLYLYCGVFFPIPLICIIWCSLSCYFRLLKQNDKLKQFCFIYIVFFSALLNCINFSIILQNFWIHIFPAFIVHQLNFKLLKNSCLRDTQKKCSQKG